MEKLIYGANLGKWETEEESALGKTFHREKCTKFGRCATAFWHESVEEQA